MIEINFGQDNRKINIRTYEDKRRPSRLRDGIAPQEFILNCRRPKLFNRRLEYDYYHHRYSKIQPISLSIYQPPPQSCCNRNYTDFTERYEPQHARQIFREHINTPIHNAYYHSFAEHQYLLKRRVRGCRGAGARRLRNELRSKLLMQVAVQCKDNNQLTLETNDAHNTSERESFTAQECGQQISEVKEIIEAVSSDIPTAANDNIHPSLPDAPGSQTTLYTADLQRALLDAYRCSMCPGFNVPEFYECPNGHTVCEECWLGLSSCTLCTSRAENRATSQAIQTSFQRVRTLEGIAVLLSFPCRWRNNGCQEVLAARVWREHVAICRHSVKLGQSDDQATARSSTSVSGGTVTDYEDDDMYDSFGD